MPMIEVITPMARTNSGNITPTMAPLVEPANAAPPRMIEATRVTSYDSNRSAAIPAQSPTLSPTLSAMVAAFRGSSSGMFFSTFPTRSAPTSAAFVKMPPPTRMNMASSAPPKPNPTSTDAASFLKIIRMTVAPSRPRPTVNIPATPPVRKAMVSARRSPVSRAALATRTFPRTASHMPANPVTAEKPAPMMKASERPARMERSEWVASSGTGRMKKMPTVRSAKNRPTVRNCRLR